MPEKASVSLAGHNEIKSITHLTREGNHGADGAVRVVFVQTPVRPNWNLQAAE
jgi:hypothetical protein